MSAPELFAWQPDRNPKFTRIEDPARDQTGAMLDVFDGAKIAEGQRIKFFLRRKGLIPDFVYDMGMRLVVSDRAMEIIASSRIEDVGVHAVDLVDWRGATHEGYSWLDVRKWVSLLDRQRSRFRVSSEGIFSEIGYFSVAPEKIPACDLFVCLEGYIRVFSNELVQRIHASGLTGAVFSPLEGLRWP